MIALRIRPLGIACCLSIILSLVSAWAEPIQLKAGETISRVAMGQYDTTYHVYTPLNYDASAKPRPLLISFSPGGNGKGILGSIKGGVEKAGWILVGCDKLKNGMKDRELEKRIEDELLDDIFGNVPHDKERVYFGGFSGGGMRSYDLTTRRSEPLAGILSYGGWLGGPDYQNNEYRKGMSVAMINGTVDRGASAWEATDTATLRKRDCVVKHYSFVGAHKVAPPEVTEMAIDWLEQEWVRKMDTADALENEAARIPLSVLCVGKDKKRLLDYVTFLSGRFENVESTYVEALTLEKVNRADVLLVDTEVRSLPVGLCKATLMMGPGARSTAMYYGLKLGAMQSDLVDVLEPLDNSHSIFQGIPDLDAASIGLSRERLLRLANVEVFEGAKDSEIVLSVKGREGVERALMVREAHQLFWGAGMSPLHLREEGLEVLVNALKWIHQFDGHQQTEFAGIRAREEALEILGKSKTNPRVWEDWFPKELLEEYGESRDTLRAYVEGHLPYLHTSYGSGLLSVDKDAAAFLTPNNEVASIRKWIEMLNGEDGKKALGLLLKYTGQRIRKKPDQWIEWLDENEDSLVFRDDKGYRFYVE